MDNIPCLKAAQTHSYEFAEIILVDGRSTDKTKQIMQEFLQKHPDYCSMKIFDNPKRKQASVWNIIIQNMTMDVLIRIDAHTKIPCPGCIFVYYFAPLVFALGIVLVSVIACFRV